MSTKKELLEIIDKLWDRIHILENEIYSLERDEIEKYEN